MIEPVLQSRGCSLTDTNFGEIAKARRAVEIPNAIGERRCDRSLTVGVAAEADELSEPVLAVWNGEPRPRCFPEDLDLVLAKARSVVRSDNATPSVRPGDVSQPASHFGRRWRLASCQHEQGHASRCIAG